MKFYLMAHKPGIIWWFFAGLLAAVLVNAFLIQFISPFLQQWNQWMKQSVILIIPWLVILFLPSFLAGFFLYHSMVRKYCFTIADPSFTIGRVNAKGEPVATPKVFEWKEVIDFAFNDFEDNEYFIIRFSEKKNNLILHRDGKEFEMFFEELKKRLSFMKADS